MSTVVDAWFFLPVTGEDTPASVMAAASDGVADRAERLSSAGLEVQPETIALERRDSVGGSTRIRVSMKAVGA